MSQGASPFVGTAAASPNDKIGQALAAKLANGESFNDLGLDLVVQFWPGAQAGDVRAVLGDSKEYRISSRDSDSIRGEHTFWISADKVGELDLNTLLETPAVAVVDVLLPKVTTNVESRQMSGSNILAAPPFNAKGSGILVGVWDGGPIEVTHSAFGNRVDYADNPDLPVNFHSTHVAGTIAAAAGGNANGQGHAPLADIVGLDFNGDIASERRLAKHFLYHHHDNHSWGLDPSVINNFSTYDQMARIFDNDARDVLLLPVKAAGNEGFIDPNTPRDGGFDSLSPDSTSKNALVVGAVYPQKFGGQYRLAEFSSRGPVEDGRVKPDITAVGVDVLSTFPNNQYESLDGTSMATPGVSGMLALLSEIFEKGRAGRRMAPDVARGVLIHTADDAGNVGPDYHFGWGVARADKAGALIEADSQAGGANIVRGAVQNGETRTYVLSVPAGQSTLKVTTTWLDAASAAPAGKDLINDLDLTLTSPNGQTFSPWVLNANQPASPATTGRNSLDNVEQVVVNNPAQGTWQVVVKGTLVADPVNPVQGFVLLSDFPLSRQAVRAGGTANTALNDNQTIEVPFNIDDDRLVESMRVYVDLQHDRRGDVSITLIHPDNTSEVLKAADNSQALDVFAIYPDTKSADGTLSSFVGKPMSGTWRLRIQDTQAQNGGTLRFAGIEFDVSGPPNEAPSAIIQGSTVGVIGDSITLSAAGSVDADGDALTYLWDQRVGPQVSIANPTGSSITVQLPSDAQQVGSSVTFGVVVTDSRGAFAEATHTVTLEASGRDNEAPNVSLRAPSRVAPNTSFSLDASKAYDADGDTLSYAWRQVSGVSVGAVGSGPVWTMVAPAAPDGTVLEFELQVTDGRSPTVTIDASVVIDSSTTNSGVQDIGPGGIDSRSTNSLVSGGCQVSSGHTLSLWLALLVMVWGMSWFQRRHPRVSVLVSDRRPPNAS